MKSRDAAILFQFAANQVHGWAAEEFCDKDVFRPLVERPWRTKSAHDSAIKNCHHFAEAQCFVDIVGREQKCRP